MEETFSEYFERNFKDCDEASKIAMETLREMLKRGMGTATIMTALSESFVIACDMFGIKKGVAIHCLNQGFDLWEKHKIGLNNTNAN